MNNCPSLTTPPTLFKMELVHELLDYNSGHGGLYGYTPVTKILLTN